MIHKEHFPSCRGKAWVLTVSFRLLWRLPLSYPLDPSDANPFLPFLEKLALVFLY